MVLIESNNMPDSTIDPNLSNPQALVDAALSGTTTSIPTPTPTTTQPTTPNIDPPRTEPQPTAPVSPLPPLEPLQSEPVEVGVDLTKKIEVADETPLAFVTPPVAPVAPEPTTPPLPPTPTPMPTPTNNETVKPKSKLGVVIGGVMVLILALGVGVWGYLGSPTKTEPAKIAVIGSDCSGDESICNASKGEVCIKTKGKEEYKCKATGGQDPCRHTICPVNYYCVNDEGAPDDAWCEPKGGSRPPGETLTCPPGTKSNGQCEDGVLRPPCCEPDTSPSPSTTTTASMACTGLTQTPSTTPVVGSKLTFTCSGSITPSSAGTLSYEFVYKLNSGGWKSLSNKTTNTAELTIATCGEYIVHCRACATINGSKQCDPVWKDVVIQ